MCHWRVLSKAARADQHKNKSFIRTLTNTYIPLGMVRMSRHLLPAFDKHCVIEGYQFHVFENEFLLLIFENEHIPIFQIQHSHLVLTIMI